ncbi:NADH-cytochrome b5 reductase [Suillus paluster]|uniref:NADH-cytochrome b5 reductase n=1 Tax=Suillus paluster TaxID=48578 RepID=UPI001B85C71B|nr:NADH-cytochrome b5 reductase [Suillus paluster]KAG1755098.1 NADH-cytochrome b5 reductase [Suillus paluster]
MNCQQALFVITFLSTLSVLIFGFHWLRAKLREAGYDVSRLILIGLEPKINTSQFSDDTSRTRMAFGIDSSYTQLVALALALASTAFIFVKFGSSSKRKPVLNPQVWQEFSLKEKIVISPNTAIYRFALPHPQDVLGLPIGQHISVSAEINGKDIMRSYTPTSSDDDLGHFDLLIKAYEKGNISRYVSLLKIGDKVRIRGPKGAFKYTPTLSREIGMIAGGTGITPMLQIIRAALKNPEDKTKLSLIYANVNVEDILLKKELDALAASHPKRFKVYYLLNNAPQGWTGGVGFVSKDQIETHLPSSSHDIKVLMCGPPPMITAMKKHLAELNYPAPRTISKLEDQVFAF